MFGLSLLLFLIAVHLPGNSGETAALLGAFGGMLAAGLLGIAWLGVLRGGQGGAGPVVGSFAFPLAVAFAYFQRGSHNMRTTEALIVGSLAAFAWGYVAAPCDAVLRWLAAASAMLWSFLFIAVVKQWNIPSALHTLSLVALALIGVCIAFSFLQLRDAPPHQEL